MWSPAPNAAIARRGDMAIAESETPVAAAFWDPREVDPEVVPPHGEGQAMLARATSAIPSSTLPR